MNKQKILSLLQEIKNELETPKKIKLEPTNLKINSDGWIKKTTNCGDEYLESPEGDCWELLKNGEQYFTRDRAMKEARKLRKRLPTKEEFNLLNKEDFGEVIYGSRAPFTGEFLTGIDIHFWSSSIDCSHTAFFHRISSIDPTVPSFSYLKNNGFSVRLVKENNNGRNIPNFIF